MRDRKVDSLNILQRFGENRSKTRRLIPINHSGKSRIARKKAEETKSRPATERWRGFPSHIKFLKYSSRVVGERKIERRKKNSWARRCLMPHLFTMKQSFLGEHEEKYVSREYLGVCSGIASRRERFSPSLIPLSIFLFYWIQSRPRNWWRRLQEKEYFPHGDWFTIVHSNLVFVAASETDARRWNYFNDLSCFCVMNRSRSIWKSFWNESWKRLQSPTRKKKAIPLSSELKSEFLIISMPKITIKDFSFLSCVNL